MVNQENRCIKTKWWDEFSQQFYDTMEKGVFRRLTVKEMVNYLGLVNCITTVEEQALLYNTLTNLYLQQHEAAGKSWNDCLMKGLSALVGDPEHERQQTGMPSPRIYPSFTSGWMLLLMIFIAFFLSESASCLFFIKKIIKLLYDGKHLLCKI
jgi:hypothetical protein